MSFGKQLFYGLGVLILCLGLANPAFSAELPDYLGSPVDQEGPIMLVGVGHEKNTEGKPYYGWFSLLNESPQPIITVQLGWTLKVCGPEMSDVKGCVLKKPLLKGVGVPIAMMVQPGREKEWIINLVEIEKIELKLWAKGVKMAQFFAFEFGIVYARFADGTEWEYDIVNEVDWKHRPHPPRPFGTRHGTHNEDGVLVKTSQKSPSVEMKPVCVGLVRGGGAP